MTSRQSRWLVVSGLVLGLAARPAVAQVGAAPATHFEAGAQYTLFHFEGDGTNHGIAGWVGYMLDPSIGFEAEVGWLPSGDGDLTEALFGVKLGDRRGRFGSYFKLRPGFVRLEVPVVCPAIYPPPPGCEVGGTRSDTRFAVDVGGIFEFLTSDKTLLRFDLGNTFVHVHDYWTNNFQLAAGFGVRF